MITLTPGQRADLLKIVDGTRPGSYAAAATILHLADGKSIDDIASVTFSTPDEIRRIERLFTAKGIEGINNFEPGQ